MPSQHTFYDLSLPELEARITEIGQPKYRARQVWEWAYRHLVGSYDEMRNVPAALRARLADDLPFPAVDTVREQLSDDALTRKKLLRLHDGKLIESVLMLYDPRSDSRGQDVLHPSRETYLDVVRALTDEGYAMCADVTAVDYLAHPTRALPEGVTPERFEVVVNMLDVSAGRRIRLRVQVPDEDPSVPSLFDIHPGTEAMEREVYDMFGITFTDHPDMTRILLWEGFNGYPLRKDFPVEGIDTGSAIYPEYYEETAGPVAGTGTGWKPAKPPEETPA